MFSHCLFVICFMSFAVCYVLFFFNFSFSCLYSCTVSLVPYFEYSVFCVVYPNVYSCLFSICIQFYLPLPPGGYLIAVNKYHIISLTVPEFTDVAPPLITAFPPFILPIYYNWSKIYTITRFTQAHTVPLRTCNLCSRTRTYCLSVSRHNVYFSVFTYTINCYVSVNMMWCLDIKYPDHVGGLVSDVRHMLLFKIPVKFVIEIR